MWRWWWWSLCVDWMNAVVVAGWLTRWMVVGFGDGLSVGGLFCQRVVIRWN